MCMTSSSPKNPRTTAPADPTPTEPGAATAPAAIELTPWAGRFEFSGAWSVRLRSGGYHADHVHPQGWISSACYIAIPSGVGHGDDRAGWLRLGKPLIPTPRPLGPERYIRPEPGVLALFPSYMWHGVEPFESDQHRLSVAFDVVPETGDGARFP